MSKETPPEQYSIRQLSEISGINAVTIRAWERRYGLLKPRRTTKGHRHYDAADIETVRNILNWLDRGVAISKVKPLLNGDASISVDIATSDNVAASHWNDTISQSLTIVGQFQREKLEQQFNELFGNYPLDTLVTNYILPMLDALDRQSKLRFGASAEKTFFTSELHTDLMSRIRHTNSNNNGERVLLLALDGQQHAISALLFALALLEAGFRLHLLLDACSLREIPYIIEQTQTSGNNAIKAVICHSSSKPDISQMDQELARAAAHARVPFFIGGDWIDITPALRNIGGITALEQPLRASVAAIIQSLRKNA